jgi:hypothetical protein
VIATRYLVVTPEGAFEALWDDDELVPVELVGSPAAVEHFQRFLQVRMVTGRNGQRLSAASIEPDDLLGFCQSVEFGISVLPDPQEIGAQLLQRPAPPLSGGAELASTLKFLQRVIDHDLPGDSVSVARQLAQVHQDYQGNVQVELLFDQAAQAYKQHLARVAWESIR